MPHRGVALQREDRVRVETFLSDGCRTFKVFLSSNLNLGTCGDDIIDCVRFRCEQLPADGSQEHDVQTAAAARQALGDRAAQHLGSQRPAGLPVCSLRPRPLLPVHAG